MHWYCKEKSDVDHCSFLDRRGGNNLLVLQHNSEASHRKYQDMADNVSEVKSTLFVYQNNKSTVCYLLHEPK